MKTRLLFGVILSLLFERAITGITVTCTPPLLCDGGSSMDLSADRTLAISPFYLPLSGGTMTGTLAMGTNRITMAGIYIPASGGAPFRMLTDGSSLTGATSEGLRSAMFSLYDTRSFATDGAAMTIDQIQTSHSGTITRTGLHVKSYTEPDNGGDVSGILSVSTGGGPAITAYKVSSLRPAGYPDQSSSPQPALEVGSADAGPAIIASAGANVWGTPLRNHAIRVTLGAATGANQSDGILIWPQNNVFDDRLALIVGSPQPNAAPVNVTASLEADGDLRLIHGANAWEALGGYTKLTNDTNDGSFQRVIFRKSRAGGSVETNEIVGGMEWNFLNSSAVEVFSGSLRLLAANKTASSEAADLALYLMSSGSLAERFRVTAAGKVGVGTASPTTGITVSASENNTTLGGALSSATRIVNTNLAGAGRTAELQFGLSTSSLYAAVSGVTQDASNNTQGDVAVSTRRATTDSNLTEAMRVSAVGNVLINGAAAGSGGFGGVVAVKNAGGAPTAGSADTAQLWAADSAAGDANLYAMNEIGIAERLTGLRKRVKTQFNKTSDTTLANVTDLTFNVEAGKSYGFSALLFTTSNATGGIKAAIGGTATATAVIYEGDAESAGALTQARATSLGTAVCDVSGGAVMKCTIEGTITVNAAGTLTVQFAQKTANGTASSVLAGSRFYLEPMGN